MSALCLESPISKLKGVGEAREKALSRSGIATVGDLLFFYPKTYRREALFPVSRERVGFFSGFSLTALSSPGVFSLGGKRALRYLAEDENGKRVNILYIHQPYLRNQIHKGDSAYYFGILQEKNGAFYLFSPTRKTEKPDPDRIRPIYPGIKGLSSGQTEKLISQVLPLCLSQIKETLPDFLLEQFRLLPRAKTVFILHSPPDEAMLSRAKERIAFEELFDFSVKARLFSRRQEAGRVQAFENGDLSPFLALLPYRLTGAQEKVLFQMRDELVGKNEIPSMNRLLQGDVGSGKTVVAAGVSFLAVQNKKSALVMAPTEILARQHYATFRTLFDPLSVPVFLLTGSTPKKEREAIFRETVKDTPYILIGTHALLEDSARCRNVAIAITDEQHRFGVRHRTVLGEKGGAVHSLVMSATPIPRSLAMFLYAKGKISVIDELPPGRKEVKTLYVGEDKLSRIYAFLQEKIALGQQAYIVCPLIEDEEEKSPLISAKEELLGVQKALGEIPCALLHGKMKPAEKNQVMEDFKSGKTKVLVSTTVIEVGVDVPNATVMVILNAERFGLSQLHQLRGRVGRGSEESFCILVSSHSGKGTRERLKLLCDCHDGFRLAQYDLKTRGPGEFFGTRQSGFGGVDLASEISMPLLEQAGEAAEAFLSQASVEELAPYSRQTGLN